MWKIGVVEMKGQVSFWTNIILFPLAPRDQRTISDTFSWVNIDKAELNDDKSFQGPSSGRDRFVFDQSRSLRTEPLLETVWEI